MKTSYTNYKELLKLHRDKSIDDFTKTHLHPNFLSHITPLLASGGLAYNDMKTKISMSAILANLTEQYGPDETIGTTKLTRSNFFWLIQFLAEVPRGKLMMGVATDKDNLRFSAFTPLVMYAYKEEYGKNYSDWDKNDKYFNLACGSTLAGVHKDANKFDAPIKLTTTEVAEIRKRALVRAGKPQKLTSNMMVISNILGKKLSKPTMKMLLQTWIANSSIRVPDAMVLNPYDWDNTPEPWDIVSVASAKTFEEVADELSMFTTMDDIK